jgi:tetratricopeptide (TPR) repeat protein
VHVESVAWVTERKNVLSGVLYLLAAHAYFRFAPLDEGRPGRRGAYPLALLLFLLALLSKTVTATLPAAILLVVWWKRGAPRRRDWLAMAPLFLIGLAAGLHTAWIEREVLGAEGAEWALPFAARLLVAGKAFWFYLGKLLWPADLAFVYPRWEVEGASPAQFLVPAAALLLLLLLWAARRRTGRGPLTALLFFGGTLLPALGFVNVYPFRFSFVADHFQYLASIGPIALFASLAARLLPRLPPFRAPVLRTASILLLLLLAVLTWRQCGIYHDLETLWRDTIEKNREAWMARVNLGQLLSSQGRTDEAIEQYEAALQIRPEYDKAHNNLGLALEARGERKRAIHHYRMAIRINPRSASALSNLGLALLAEGETGEAIDRLREALTIRPAAPELHINLAVALARTGRVAEAERALREALRLDPENATARTALRALQGGG